MAEASDTSFRIFIGWDSREDIAYQVCRFSALRRSTMALDIAPLKQVDLRALGLYRRPVDPLASTEFTYTRFLVPFLTGYRGWALFCDCDILFQADLRELSQLADPRYAAMCVHHDHRPPEGWKMDGRVQTLYPRKNWSSLVLYNCGHPANRALDLDLANGESGAYLHRFAWLDDALIGALPESWNWLEGWSKRPDAGTPKAIHYTRGGPWFAAWQDVDFAAQWLAEERAMLAAAQAA